MMYLHEIDVLPSYQRQGIGTALIEELKRICRTEGITKMWLGTSESNIAAMALYQKTGGMRLSTGEAGFQWTFQHCSIE
jgi:ribosomal protein S18 acetylase RimI-like enzyme